MPSEAEVSESTTSRTSWSVSRAAEGAHVAKAPRGKSRAEEVPTAHRVSHSLAASDDSASRAIRPFPTPAAPEMITPQQSGSDIAASMTRKYGRKVTSLARRNDDLLAGLRVRVGDDVYESSVAGQLATLAAAV